MTTDTQKPGRLLPLPLSSDPVLLQNPPPQSYHQISNKCQLTGQVITADQYRAYMQHLSSVLQMVTPQK